MAFVFHINTRQAVPNLTTLPEFIRVVEGESGYHLSSKVEYSRFVEAPQQVQESAVEGSMFGWDTPAAALAVVYVTWLRAQIAYDRAFARRSGARG